MTETFAELFESSVKDAEMRPGMIILGEVIEIGKETVIVSAGLKSEAEIPLWQFKDMKGELSIQVGEEVEVEIEALEDGHGRTRLSREKACRARAWEEIEAAFAEQTIVEGVITARIKGGFTVSVKGIRAFLPGSLYGIRAVTEADEEFQFEKGPLEFKVIKMDRARNNVVVSRRAALEKELNEQREALLSTLEEGQVVEGMVKNLTDYGVFVNLGGIDGLLHITDLAWRRVKHPSDVVSVGETLSVKVLKFERDKSRISLGLKQLTEDPWLNVQRRYKVGSRVIGVVTSAVDYGIFVELEEGVRGLAHVSQLDWTSRNVHPPQVYNVGDEVEVMVLEVDVVRHRISLGVKQCLPNPWTEFAAAHKPGDHIVGEIKSVTDFGIFVSLENNIDGLVHINDLDWYKDGEEVIQQYSKGEEVEVVVLAIDAGRERISIGIKQVSGDPYLEFVGIHSKGSVVDGVVASIDKKGVHVRLGDGVTGIIRPSELSKDSSEQFAEGSEVTAKIMSIERKSRKIFLSVKVLEVERERQEIEVYSKESDVPMRTSLATEIEENQIKEKIRSES